MIENKILFIDLCKEINDQWSNIWGLKIDEDPQEYFMRIETIDQLKLLFKTSDRLREDFEEDSSQGKLIIRKWFDHLPNEYRCFICHGKLNAISAYQTIDNEQSMKDFLNSKSFKEIILSIPYRHAVVDCAIDPINYQVIIIEINPFSKRSSAAKFSWVIDRDILYNHYNTNGFVYVRF
jgi:hypothetical protein